MATLLLRDGQVVDGTGAAAFEGHVLIDGDRIEVYAWGDELLTGCVARESRLWELERTHADTLRGTFTRIEHIPPGESGPSGPSWCQGPNTEVISVLGVRVDHDLSECTGKE